MKQKRFIPQHTHINSKPLNRRPLAKYAFDCINCEHITELKIFLDGAVKEIRFS